MFFLSDQRGIVNRLNTGSKAIRSEYKRVDQLNADYSKSVGWWGTFYELAKEDITRLPDVLKTPLEQVLLWL
jgi:hypothetical protein